VSVDRVDGSVSGALGSVRQLEGALEASATARAAAESRVREARAEAARLLAEAREDSAAAAAERRRVVLDSAEEEAAAIQAEGEARAAGLRADARKRQEAAVEAALALILPAAGESGA
jgi:vacuolar-type H+-ATPase subunit H